MEWPIRFQLTRKGSTLATATFVLDDLEIGSVDVDPQTQGSGDMAFVELIRRPHRWNVLPPDLHRALLVYRQETLADVDYRDKTYRFLRVRESEDSHWKLTEDKSDIRVPKDVEGCGAM